MRQVLWFGLLMGGMTLAPGCNKSPTLVPVSGRVTLDGKPVKEMMVNFLPIGDTQGSGAIAHTDSDGQFTLLDMRGEAGVHVGDYKVSLYPGVGSKTKEGDPAEVVMFRGGSVPGIYIDADQTPLRAIVPPGGGTI